MHSFIYYSTDLHFTCLPRLQRNFIPNNKDFPASFIKLLTQQNTPTETSRKTHSSSPPAVILTALHKGFILPVDGILVHWLKTNLPHLLCESGRTPATLKTLEFKTVPLQRSVWHTDDYISGLPLSLDLFFDFLFSPLCCVAADRKCHRYTIQMVNIVTKASSGNSPWGCMLSAAWAFSLVLSGLNIIWLFCSLTPFWNITFMIFFSITY